MTSQLIVSPEIAPKWFSLNRYFADLEGTNVWLDRNYVDKSLEGDGPK
jgi:hypothetical protein